MTTNPYERAVIDAARALAAADRYDLGAAASSVDMSAFLDAVRALEAHEAGQSPTIEQYAEELKEINVRAYGSFMRQYEASLNGFGHWPRLDSLVQFATLTVDDIIDVRNAGPVTWRIWAGLLRKYGLEPTWAKVIGDDH